MYTETSSLYFRHHVLPGVLTGLYSPLPPSHTLWQSVVCDPREEEARIPEYGHQLARPILLGHQFGRISVEGCDIFFVPFFFFANSPFCGVILAAQRDSDSALTSVVYFVLSFAGTGARPVLTVTCFDDLVARKGIVLVRGEIVAGPFSKEVRLSHSQQQNSPRSLC